MTNNPSEKLRELALSVTRGDLRRPWSVQTSNSFRRIGTDRGDGDVLCAVTHPIDGHPDLHAAPDVLDYIVAAHPFAILRLLSERDSARHALHFLRHKIAGRDRVFRETGGIAEIYLARATVGVDRVPTVVRARDQIAEVAGAGEAPEDLETQLPGDAEDPAGSGATAHPPIASYTLGQGVTFHPGRGDRWYPGIVTRLESGLRSDRSAWHTIFVSSTRDLPSGEWERAGEYRFEDRDGDAARVSPARDGAMTWTRQPSTR